MSMRFKRQLSKAGGSAEGGGGAPSAAARKKRRIDNSGSDDEERSVWTPKHLGDLRAYNRSASEAPAELFRKDLISAMKLADNEPLSSDDYWGIGDTWRQDWERGVQVPVNPDSLPESTVTVTIQKPQRDREANFRLNEQHILSNLPTKAEKMCRYDMDDLDDKWLNAYNGERARMGAAPVPPLIFEMIIEHLEETCCENIHKLLKTEESLSIEFDEDVICDVCRSMLWRGAFMSLRHSLELGGCAVLRRLLFTIKSAHYLTDNRPDSEEGNEMVFCDSCNICVHQACYGITAIPSGSWLCRTCSLGIKPDCVLCPNKGGAMKSTKSGQKWAHVACALWIPEVSIGSVERMEPITKIPNIPQSRWALVCVLCRERRGACIQCSVKTCKTAYHVTCAFKHGLEMKAIIEDESADDGVKLRSYCEKHSVSSKKPGNEEGESEEGEEGVPKKKKDWTSEQKNQARAAKLRQIESEFFKHVDVLETSNFLDIDFETTETIFNYWKLKRRASFNKPLLTPRSEEIDLLSHQQEHDIERMKMFVQLRQYLERVRNLCYMVNRRERLSRSFIKIREQTFSKQASLLNSNSLNLTSQEAEAVMQANHGPSVYDRLYSHHTAPQHTQKQFEKIIACIAGTLTEKVKSKKPPQKKDVNGLIRPKKEKSDNPYKKVYVNGAEQRRSRSSSLCSTSDSDSSLASTKWTLPPKGSSRHSVYTSSEEEMNKENRSIKLEPVSSKSKLLESSDKEKLMVESGSMSTRGRVGRRRGSGRANAIKSKSFRDRIAASSDDKDTKDFDALISEKCIKSETNASSSKTVRECPCVESSEDETETVCKPKPQPSKRRNKKKVTPPKVESSVSSEDEPSVTVTPSKEKKCNRKGKWMKSGTGTELTSVGSPVSEPPKLELSDDDELGPPTYKLSSDEDNSEKSNDPTAISSDVFGVSDRTDSSSDNGRNTALSKGPKKRDKKNETILSDSDVNSDDDNKESTIDSQNHATLKTKAAKKEFTPKIEAKAERMNKKKSDKGGRTAKKTISVEKGKIDSRQLDEVDTELVSPKNSEVETTPGHLFVPQRKAAKKASELITSQNTTSTSATTAVAIAAPTPADTTTAEAKKTMARQVKDVKEEPEEPEIIEERKSLDEKRVSPSKGRKGKINKDKNDKVVEDCKVEASDAPKKNLFEPPEILPYVPMRQAAKKAAENLKGGNSKVGASVTIGAEEPEVSPVTVVPPAKAKRISRQESKSGGRPKSKSPRATKHPSPTTVTDTESESELEGLSVTRRGSKDQKNLQKSSKSIFSDSDEESATSAKKEKVIKEKSDPVPEIPKEAQTGGQFFRGDMFVREYQSSSDENDSGRPTTPGRKTHMSPARRSGDECQESSSKNQSFRSSTNISGDLHLTSDSDEREDENQEPAVGTLRKAPDKKLKTSEGRPEHGFQPPITERSESRVSTETKDDSAKPTVRREAGLEPRLRQSGPQCRPRTPSCDVPLQDIRSNSHAPSRGPRRGREREPPSLTYDLVASHNKLPGRREIQLEESHKPSKKITEGDSEEKSATTKGVTPSKKEEALKEREALCEKKELLKERKDVPREKEGPKDKNSLLREREIVHIEKDIGERESETASIPKAVASREQDIQPKETDSSGDSSDIIIEKEVQREKVLPPRERILSPKAKVLPSRERILHPREKVLPFREKASLPQREKDMPPREVVPTREKVLSPREKVPSREKKEDLREQVSHKEKEALPAERKDTGEKDLPKENNEIARARDSPEDHAELQRKQSQLVRQKLEMITETEQTEESEGLEKVEGIQEEIELVREKEPLRTETRVEEVIPREEETVRTLTQAPAEPEVLTREKDSTAGVLDIPVNTEQQKKPGVFGYVDEEVKVERLEDIVETSDTEPENKRVRVGDSDEDSMIVSGDKRVEQPKDSGYKSAITTPEPVDRVQPVCNDLVSVNNVVNNFIHDESCLEVVDSNSKTPVVVPSPVELKQTVNKFVSPTRRKNLEDVIGEMKRQAEAQPEPSNSVSSTDIQNELTASPQHSQPSSANFSIPPPESSVSSSQASSVETLTPKRATSPTANFVEQWRGQWVKSPPPPDRKGDPSSGTHLPPHLPMGGLDLGLPQSMSMLDLRARYPDAPPQLFNPYEILSAPAMLPEALLRNRLRQMMEARIPAQLYNLAFIQQHNASEIAALSQQQYAQSSRENQIPDKPSICSAPDLARLTTLDNRPPTPEILQTNNKANNRPAATGNKVGKPLTSPGLQNMITAPPLSSPTSCNKIVQGLTLPTTSRGQQHTASREKPPSPVLPRNETAQPQISPTGIFNKTDASVSSASQPTSQPPQNTVPLPEVSPADHSVLLSRVNRVSLEPQVSPESTKASQVAVSASITSSDTVSGGNKCPLVSPTVNSVLTTKNVLPPISNSIMSVAKSATTTTSLNSLNTSPLSAVTSPLSQRESSPLHTTIEVPDSKIETITVDDNVIHQKEEPVQKRVPIYMQELKSQKILEKKSPRSRTVSPRWNKESTRTREKKSAKVNRMSYNKGRGRNAGKGKGRGYSPRFNSVSVPKELVGTVYDFDFDNEFDDDYPANNTLDDLRKSREKRQSVDTTPQQQQSSTPTYLGEHKEQSPKKSGKKSKSSYKDKGPSKMVNDDDDKVAKILEDYRNTQKSQLRRSVHSPTPPQGDTVPDGPPKTPDRLQNLPQLNADYTANISETKLTISNNSEARDSNQNSELTVIQKATGDHSKVSISVPTAQIGIDERTNQLKLKIKGPYANSYSNSSTAAPPQEAVGAPTPTSTTSTLRRMRKKELIRQYCYQDQMPAEPPESGPINNAPNPQPHVRTGITIPKAVASMISIPTREDYKMYTQDEPPSTTGGGGRRKRPPRELRHLNVWTIREESGKRNSETAEISDASRKRPRGAKDSKNLEEKDVSSVKPPKLRISLGKKGSEVTTVTTDTKELAGKQRPPKKRLAEENPMVKIRSDSMKFREQIMADFDKPGKKGGLKGSDRDKKAKKRKVHSGELGYGSSTEKDSTDKHDIKVITGDSTNAPKLVIRFGKGKSENSNNNRNTKGESNDSGSSKEERVDSDTVMPHSLKIRLSLPKPDSDSNKEESSVPKEPLRLKLSRRSDGYVASNTPRKPQSDVQDQGPGPPDPKPPDPPESQPDISIPDTAPPSPRPPPDPSITGEPQANSRLSQENPPPPVSTPYDVYPHQGDPPMSFNSSEHLNMGPVDYGLGGLGPPPRSDLPEETLQRLEAQIAAAGRSITESGGPAGSLGPPPQQSGPPLPDVPSLHHTICPYKEGSDCR
ncbi:uncharacterized protein rno isoform X2 [Panulirus ornatus]|uniref:uncharacterized protein rno isoform X2 n=1 Tax=Panulirus ornatus TaxID=150431 RepID=UPI003A864271